MKHRLELFQKSLKHEGIDAYIAYDFAGNNKIARAVCQIPENLHTTRRFAYFIPQHGSPVKIVHAIENDVLDHLPGEKKTYLRWEEWEMCHTQLLMGKKQVALEYVTDGANPYISITDAGFVDFIRKIGCEVVSSGTVVQAFTATWDDAMYLLWKEALAELKTCYNIAWKMIREALLHGKKITEGDVATVIADHFSAHGFVSAGGPIVAVNANTANPHYHPNGGLPIQSGDIVLIDIFCKKNVPNGVYADLCKVAICAPFPTDEQKKVFDIVMQAQQAAFALLKSGPKKGFEVDQAARKVIDAAGYGKYFTHRLGHNIHTTTHGIGANLDGLETKDERLLIPRTCFSVEPGIYLPNNFGVRLENDVFIHADGHIEIEGGIEHAFIQLM